LVILKPSVKAIHAIFIVERDPMIKISALKKIPNGRQVSFTVPETCRSSSCIGPTSSSPTGERPKNVAVDLENDVSKLEEGLE